MAEDGARRVGLLTLADLATPMAVRVAATLRVADHIAAGRRTSEHIAESTATHSGSLDRLLRHLVTIGLLSRDEAGAYDLTTSGEQLRDDHPAGKRKWLDINGAVGRGDLGFVELAHTVRTGEPSYPVRYAASFWDDLGADPALSASFDNLMSHHMTIDNSRIADAYDWASLEHVVDVGGGSGALLATLLQAHSGLRGTLVDLEGPAAAARATFTDQCLARRAQVVTGSFFEPLPARAGGYVLSAVLHDWDDASAVAILRRCAQAAGAEGRVLVIEAVGGDGESTNTAMDLRMLTFYGGKERGLSELAELAARAGLTVRAVHPIGYTAIVELAGT